MKDKYYLAELFGKNVKKYREKENISVEELGQKSNISEKYLKRIEKGMATGVKFTQAIRIAKSLGIELYKLFEN